MGNAKHKVIQISEDTWEYRGYKIIRRSKKHAGGMARWDLVSSLGSVLKADLPTKLLAIEWISEMENGS